MANSDDDVTEAAAKSDRGYIIAAAGCGKTEQIARAVKRSAGRRLILTHTNAGVDVLRSRLIKLGVPSESYRLDTIAGWSLRFAQSFPSSSGLAACDRRNTNWNAVYNAANTLVEGGVASNVIAASYSGLFVDEYQDCSTLQHKVVNSLAKQLPTCIFGDPLQAIFDFDGQQLVDWEKDIKPSFKMVGELKTAHRWRNVGSHEMAEWLEDIRKEAEQGRFSFNNLPSMVRYETLSATPAARAQAIVASCKAAHGDAGLDRLMVIADPVNIHARTAIAEKLGRYGFSNIEPVGCKPLYDTAGKIEGVTGMPRLKFVLDFADRCMTGLSRSALDRAIESHTKGGKLGRTKYGGIIDLAMAIADNNDYKSVSSLLDALPKLANTNVFCRERYSSFRRALETKERLGLASLADAIWEVENRDRHIGRRMGHRAVGSTLLVKGLECEYGVVVHATNMSASDWYVALTRATKGLRILAPSVSLGF